jgi:hypothetical protein
MAISGNRPAQEDDVALDFVGMNPDSPHGNCPAVHRDRETGDGLFVGKIVSDPEVLAEVAAHGDIDVDEGVFRMPAAMWPIIAKAAAGDYELGQSGHGPLTIEDMIGVTRRTAVHLEMRDDYGLGDPSFLQWKQTGQHPADDERDEAWRQVIRAATDRGVSVRRLRVVSEPLTDYIRWEHAITTQVNAAAGEEVRWLPRSQALGLMLPAHDLWVFDNYTVRYAHFAPDGDLTSEVSTTDPRQVTAVVGAFQVAWDLAIPHANFKP